MTPCGNERARLQHRGDVRTLADYIAAITEHLDGATSYLFRGHREAKWPLKPGIARYNRNSVETERDMLEEFKRRSIPYLAIFAHPPKTEDLHQTLSRIGFQRRISAGNALD